MKIQCQSCQAKYTIADEKVLGKVVKIRCKKCSSTIVINGNEQPHADAQAGTDVVDYASQSNEPWTVNVADGDQRTMTVEEIVAEYKNGVVNDETYCWKDGMADWLPLREVEAIANAVKGGPRMADEVSVAPQSVPPPGGSLFGGGGGESPFAASVHANGNGGAIPTALFGGAGGAVEQAAPAAARRAGGRGQGGDLFGNVEKAGGEDDVMTSAAGGAGTAEEKLTGQRNENSVLFSLAALTEKNAPAGGSGGGSSSGNRTTATADGSGLIDIRALSANMDEGDKKKDKGARVDDIMNLSGGGAFGAALAAPILAPPPLEAVDLGVVAAPEAPKQNKTLIFAILGGCAFIAVAIIAVAALMRPSGGDTTKTGSPTGSATTADPTTSPTVAATPTATTTATTGGTTTAANDTPPPPGTGVKTTPAPTGQGGGGAVAVKGTPTAATTGATPAPAPAPAPTQPKDLQSALDDAAGKHNAPAQTGGGGASTAQFDRGAAAAALGKIDVSSCKQAGGPTGQGHVTVTFQPDGSVQSAVVDQGPFPGTSVAGCIGGKFRGAHVPAFGGSPVRVGKSFSIL